MELINRYSKAVGFWLPKKLRDDIIAELSEEIRSQVEDKEAEFGRKLSEAEIAAVLKRLGSPLVAANRYLPQRHLIGPVLFPIYQRVLMPVIVCCLVLPLLAWIGLMPFGPGRHAWQSGGSFLSALGSCCGFSWLSAFLSVGVVTVAFALIERTKAMTKVTGDWDPLKLPAVRDPHLIRLSSSIFDLIFSAVFLVGWVGCLGLQVVFYVAGAKVTLAPSWPYLVSGFVLVLLASIALSGVNLFRPRWTRVRAAVRLAIDCAGSALFCWFLKAGILLEIAVANVPQARESAIKDSLNSWASRAFPLAVIISAVIALLDVRRLYRVGNTAATATTRRTKDISDTDPR